MVDPTDQIARQARSGSVAAIIQLMNEKLASSGVRTRAIRENGVLQMLCEAESAEQLERSTLVPQIREILQNIGPRNIRRVRINCRIVREQQLLWLEEISRDPENQLLWVEEIVLAKRNPLQRLATDLREGKTMALKRSQLKASVSPFERDRRQWRRGMLGGVILSLCLLLSGWAVYKVLASKESWQTKATKPASSALSPNQQSPNLSVSVSDRTDISKFEGDPFVAAVRMAEKASIDGKRAQSRTEWLDIANRWQQASDLMAQVAETDRRYETAQNRKSVYRKNSELALRQLQKRRS